MPTPNADAFGMLDTAIGQLCWQVELPLLRQIVVTLNQRAGVDGEHGDYQGAYPEQVAEARDIALRIWRIRA